MTTATDSGSPSTLLTAVSFRAREKMCINSVYACREEFCPHLQMFPLKLERSSVLDRLLANGVTDADALVEAGRGAGLCPFELALIASERTDAIVCDYNYVFDPQVYLRRFFLEADYSNAILVIDEAHNLVTRAMDYYSPVLRRSLLGAVEAELARVTPDLARDFRRLLGRIDDYFHSLTRHRADEYSQVEDAPPPDTKVFTVDSPRPFFEELRPALNRLAVRYLLDKITSGRALPADPIEDFLAELGHFIAVLALAGPEFSYVYDETAGPCLKVVCLDPSRQLAARLAGFHSVIAMSATLNPLTYHRDLLGFEPERTGTLNLPTPFPPANRGIFVVRDVFTTYRRRQGEMDKIAGILRAVTAAHAGNCMALFPSYEFLRSVWAALTSASTAMLDLCRGSQAPVIPSASEESATSPPTPDIRRRSLDELGMTTGRRSVDDSPGAGVVRDRRAPYAGTETEPSLPLQDRSRTHPYILRAPDPAPALFELDGYQVIVQQPQMTEPERDAVIEALHSSEPPKLVLAVQGGVFAEGVDYPGEVLSTVVVVSPALPTVSYERELIRRYHDNLHGKGFEHAYLYPGMNRVVQAVGRLIRSETDRGAAVLVCQRFATKQYADLFPADWTESLSGILTARQLGEALAAFWLRFRPAYGSSLNPDSGTEGRSISTGRPRRKVPRV